MYVFLSLFSVYCHFWLVSDNAFLFFFHFCRKFWLDGWPENEFCLLCNFAAFVRKFPNYPQMVNKGFQGRYGHFKKDLSFFGALCINTSRPCYTMLDDIAKCRTVPLLDWWDLSHLPSKLKYHSIQCSMSSLNNLVAY